MGGILLDFCLDYISVKGKSTYGTPSRMIMKLSYQRTKQAGAFTAS